jgi:N6-L-threonylcarbamoyladenine synthase
LLAHDPSHRLNFSFSGIKSASKREVVRRLEQNGGLTEADKEEIAYELQTTMVNILTTKCEWALTQTQALTLVVGGGVSASTALKKSLEAMCARKNITCLFPAKSLYSTDNAAMIGAYAWRWIEANNIQAME